MTDKEECCEVCGWNSIKEIRDLYNEDTDYIEFGEKIATLIEVGVLWITESMQLYLSCNDVFYWACADAEPIEPYDISELFEWWLNDTKWGAIKFACKKRGMQPQIPMKRDMKKDDKWDDWMEQLKNTNHKIYDR